MSSTQRPASTPEPPPLPIYEDALRSFLSLLDTSLPISLVHDTQDGRRPYEDPKLLSLSLREAALAAASYPPRFITCSEPSTTDSVSSTSDGEAPYAITPSKNISFFKTCISRGVLPELISRLTTPSTSARGSPWQATAEAQALNRLIATFGISPFLDRPYQQDGSKNVRATKAPTPQQNVTRKDEEEMLFRDSVSALSDNSEIAHAFKAIRFAMQQKVYDLRYLSRKRAWGPFLPVPLEPVAKTGHGAAGSSTTSGDDDDDEYDDDYHPLFRSTSTTPEDSDEEEPEDQLILPWPEWMTRPERPLPDAQDLRADWEHLAAIRVVVQARLEEKMKALQANFGQWFEAGQLSEFHDTLLGWHAVRTGVWSTGAPRDNLETNEEQASNESPVTGTSKENASTEAISLLKTPNEPPIEWDWAGVEGIWRSGSLPVA